MDSLLVFCGYAYLAVSLWFLFRIVGCLDRIASSVVDMSKRLQTKE